MSLYARVEGALVEPVGHLWAAFSPLTGETALLNDESAAILEILELGAAPTLDICQKLSADNGMDVDALAAIVQASWPGLIDAGLVRALPGPAMIAA